MFGRLKNKLHRQKHKKEAPQKANTQLKPDSVEAPPVVKKADPPEPAKKLFVQQDPPTKDRWQDAFKKLPQHKQAILKEMGFGKPNSGSMESSIGGLVGVVNQKQEECEKKMWHVSVGGKEIRLRDYTTSIVGWLEKAGDIAIQFAPPQASLPWDLVKSLMKIPVNESEQMCALLATTERIVRITSRGQVYEQVYLSNTPDDELKTIQKNLEAALVKIYTTTLELLADSGSLLDKNTAKRTVEAIVNPGKFSGRLSGLEEDEDELLRDVQACEAQRSADADDRMIDMLKAFGDPLLRIDEGIGHLLDHMEESERIKMLEWISPIPFGKHHDRVKEHRTPGTGKWLLQVQDFRSWEAKSESVLFWLQGPMGTGKTYLTSTVIDCVQGLTTNPPKDEGFAFFYCDRVEKSRAQPLSILQSLVRQLSTTASNPESAQNKLRNAYKEAREKGTNFRLEQCKQLILASLNIYQKTTLVIDALDECDPESRDDLIHALNSFIRDSEKPVKIFISSRPDPDIQSELESSSNIGIQVGNNQDDIEKYLDIELDSMAKKAAVIKRMKPDIIRKLLERCQGMFQWAALQVQQIKKCRTESSVWDRLENLPSDLQKAYDEVWTQIEELGEPDQTLVKRALLWAMASCKPMTSYEILSAIRMDSNGDILPLSDKLDESGLLSLCNSFLVVDSQLQVWRFPHLSVRDYLEAKKHRTLPQAHCYAASVCLSYFVNSYKNHDPEEEPESIESESEEPPVPDETDDRFARMHRFHVYMRHCWVQHVHGAKVSEAVELSAILKTFLGPPDDSSVQYRRWCRLTERDFEYFPYKSEYSYYKEAHFDFDMAQDIISELTPEDAASFAMCRFSLATTLSGWWEHENINISRVNKRGHNLLALAARAGCLSICKELVDRGVDVNLRLKEGLNHGNALTAAASQGHIEVVKYLVEAGADVNMALAKGEGQYDNALAAAIESGNVPTAKYLIEEAGADINMPLPRSSFGHALGEAANVPGTGMLQLLLNAGADVNARLNYRWSETVLTTKIRNDDLASVKYLVQKAGADVNMPLEYHYASAIEVAVSRRDINISRFLIQEAGADINVQYTSGIYGSALAEACAHELEVVKLLVEAGADINTPLLIGNYGSALAVACVNGGIEVVQYLLSAGADVNMPLRQGRFGSALAAAAHESLSVDIIKCLVEAGANINMQLEHGEFGSALAAAGMGTEYGDVDAYGYLVEAGADINMPLEHGPFGSAFAAAVFGRQFYKIETLLQNNVDVDMPLKGKDFGSAFALAAAFYEDGTPQMLVDSASVNPKHPGARYGSPLIAAACFGQKDCVEFLIKAGANVNLRFENLPYASALHAARSDFSPQDIAWILRLFGGNEDDLEEIIEEWGEQKTEVAELLEKNGATA